MEKNNVSKTLESELSKLTITEITPSGFNPMDVLTERQKIALAGKWASLKEAERDQYAEHVKTGITDSATLYCIATITTEANNRIFSESRPIYLATLLQWYLALTSSEDAIRNFATTQLSKLQDETNGTQQLTLLSAVKSRLMEKRTFLPEAQEHAFRALCRFYGYDVNMVK
jgi:hypothetical protein